MYIQNNLTVAINKEFLILLLLKALTTTQFSHHIMIFLLPQSRPTLAKPLVHLLLQNELLKPPILNIQKFQQQIIIFCPYTSQTCVQYVLFAGENQQYH